MERALSACQKGDPANEPEREREREERAPVFGHALQNGFKDDGLRNHRGVNCKISHRLFVLYRRSKSFQAMNRTDFDDPWTSPLVQKPLGCGLE